MAPRNLPLDARPDARALRQRLGRCHVFHALDYNNHRDDLNASWPRRALICVKLGKV
jgi:hypothetical protein